MKVKKTIPQKLTAKERKHMQEYCDGVSLKAINKAVQFQRDKEMYCSECDKIAIKLKQKGYYEHAKTI